MTGRSVRPPEARISIRLGNEQLALPLGVTLIGRDASACRICIFDGSISRRHARIQCDAEQATIEDLGSRNGTRLNGIPVERPHVLREGDRLGIGGFELTVQRMESGQWADVPTGLIRVCGECHAPYSADSALCPHCGAEPTKPPEQRASNDDTVRGRWSLGMLVEMLGRSMLAERASDVEKLMRQAATVADEQLREGGTVEPDELRALVEVAQWLAKVQARGPSAREPKDSWLQWVQELRARVGG